MKGPGSVQDHLHADLRVDGWRLNRARSFLARLVFPYKVWNREQDGMVVGGGATTNMGVIAYVRDYN